MKTTSLSRRKQPLMTRQDIIHITVLIILSLLFCLIPKYGFGQPMLGSIVPEPSLTPATSDGTSVGLSAYSTVAVATLSDTTQAATTPLFGEQVKPEVSLSKEIPTAPREGIQSLENLPMSHVEQTAAPAPQTPAPRSAFPSAVTANSYSPSVPQKTYQSQGIPKNEPIIPSDHPFFAYWEHPSDTQTMITGKSMTVAELVADTWSPYVQCQLLQAYWELSGLLAIYHFRCEADRNTSRTTESANVITLIVEQRRIAELEFIKKQWVLAELLKQHKGKTIHASDLPIPADFPLCPRYQTHAEKLARSERTQYLARMIPIQEQLIESKNRTWDAVSGITQSTLQTVTASPQRATAFLDLAQSIVEYNKMIAEYATETIPFHANPQRLVEAVVRSGKRPAVPTLTQNPQHSTQDITLAGYLSKPEMSSAEQAVYEYSISQGNVAEEKYVK